MSGLKPVIPLDFRSATAVLDRYLKDAPGRPLAVGFSGGGDSLFLLRLALDWGRRHHRPVLAIGIDHGLQPQSAEWARWCALKAQALGAGFVCRTWDGPKPETGLSAAARLARHGLLADEARRAGASVLLLGHTLDDLYEAELMALEGSSVGLPRVWSPSPVWPDGRGIFLLRPLLGLRRAALRRDLQDRQEQWIEDPANESATSARARARSRLARDPAMQELSLGAPPSSVILPARFEGGAASGLELDWPVGPTVLGMACLCAGGGSRPPRRDQLTQLWEELDRCDHFCATLAGARIDKAGDHIRIVRNAGDRLRTHAAPLVLEPGSPAIWDGRYEVRTEAPGLEIQALEGFFKQLPEGERDALKAYTPMARRALPAVLTADGRVSCPVLANDERVILNDLVVSRFGAACGQVGQEP